jgi:hypothetical protein
MSSAETRSVSVELGGQLLTSQLLWLGVPLAIGLWRVRRRDIS